MNNSYRLSCNSKFCKITGVQMHLHTIICLNDWLVGWLIDWVIDWLIDWLLLCVAYTTYPFYRKLIELGRCSDVFSEGVTSRDETGQCCYWHTIPFSLLRTLVHACWFLNMFLQSCDLRTDWLHKPLWCVLDVLNAYTLWTSVCRLIRRTWGSPAPIVLRRWSLLHY
jgi:hypothetical protein